MLQLLDVNTQKWTDLLLLGKEKKIFKMGKNIKQENNFSVRK